MRITDKNSAEAVGEPLFVERVPDPPPDMLFRSRRGVIVFRLFIRGFVITLVVAIPYFLGTSRGDLAFDVDPKWVGASVAAILAVAILALLETDFNMVRPLLKSTSPITLYPHEIRVPVTAFERVLMGRAPLVPLERVESVTFRTRKDRARDCEVAEVVLVAVGGRRYDCGTKLASEMAALREAIGRTSPHVNLTTEASSG